MEERRARGREAALEALEGMDQNEVRQVLEEHYLRQGISSAKSYADKVALQSYLFAMDEIVTKILGIERGSFALAAYGESPHLRAAEAIARDMGWEAAFAACAYSAAEELKATNERFADYQIRNMRAFTFPAGPSS